MDLDLGHVRHRQPKVAMVATGSMAGQVSGDTSSKIFYSLHCQSLLRRSGVSIVKIMIKTSSWIAYRLWVLPWKILTGPEVNTLAELVS